MLDLQELVVQLLLLDLPLHPEDLHLVLALRLREPVQPVGRLLDDLLEDLRGALLRAFIARDLQGEDLHAAALVEGVVALVHGLRDRVQLLHEGLEGDLCDMLDELGPCLVEDVAGQVACGSHQLRQVHDLPEHGNLEHKLNVVRRAAVKLKPHVLRPAVKDLDAQVPLLAPKATAPPELHNLLVRRQEEGRGLLSVLLDVAVVEDQLAVLVLGDEGLVAGEPDLLADLLDGLGRPRHEERLVGEERQLAALQVAHQHGALVVHLHGLLLAAVQGPLVGAKEDPLGAAHDPDLAGLLVLHPDVLVHLEVDGLELVPVQQLLVRPRDHDLLPAVHGHLACEAVEQAHVLKGLERQRLPCAADQLPRRLQEDHGLPLLHPPLARRLVLDPDVLVVLKGDGGLRPRVVVERPGGVPHARSLHERLLAREPVLHHQVLCLAERGGLVPQRHRVVRPEEEQLGASLHALLPVDAVLHVQVLNGAQHLRRPLFGLNVPQGVHDLDARPVDDNRLAELLDDRLLALVEEDHCAAE
mmetsp:Transcript_54285/g.168402  ORF Transcript_54285/g.168402 Transcript_54285/m.168402 type:complete len:528 (+) Transcript_54285:432-2015(+)